MDTSKEFSLMLDNAIKQQLNDFKDFDRTKNVQDQLQEMVKRGWVVEELIGHFDKWFDELLEDYNQVWFNNYTSMEQLWLAFVMSEKYQKTWNGKEWE